MRALLAVLLLGLAACYTPRAVGSGDGYTGLYGGAAYDEPLHASLWIDPYTGSTSFDLNRPAHVALFVWEPGRTFSMVYPRIGYGTRQFFHAGRNHLWGPALADARGGMFSRRSTSTSLANWYGSSSRHGFGGTGMAGPTYYVLVASEEPLEVSRFYHAGASFAHRAYWSSNLYTATELLASQIVPNPGQTDWTVAYQIAWPDRPVDDYRWVACPDGTRFVVPLDLLLRGAIVCPDGARAEPPPGDTIDAETRAGIAPGIADRAAALRGVSGALDRDRADEDEVRALIRRLQEARGAEADDDGELPVPAWRRGERERAGDRPVTATDSRPVIRPLPSPRGEDARARPATTRAEPASPTRADRPRTRRTPATPATRSPPAADRRSPPPADRRPPPAEPRSPPPPPRERTPPRPQPEPDDDAR